MLDRYRRVILYVALFLVSMLIWTAWVKEHPQTPLPTDKQALDQNQTAKDFTPSVQQAIDVDRETKKNSHLQTSADKIKKINVETDTATIFINAYGGDIISFQLKNYPMSLQDKTPIEILRHQKNQRYIAQSGVTGKGKVQPLKFSSNKSSYTLNPEDKSLTVHLKATTSQGLIIEKSYTFYSGRYDVTVQQTVTNQGKDIWQGGFYHQIIRQPIKVKHKFLHPTAFQGASVSSPEKPYRKLTYKKMDKENLSMQTDKGWVAMQQHYFVSAWVPDQKTMFDYYSNVTHDGNNQASIYTIGYVSKAMSIKPGQSMTQTSSLYVGPEISRYLDPLSPTLRLTIDYGWLTPLSSLIFVILKWIESWVGNWGWAIVIVTILIKIILYYPSAISYRSMAKMKAIAPKMEALKKRFADDKQGLSKATIELYKTEKVSPLGGCLPMIVQIPIFYALYFVLIESVQLRQAPFILWVHDLAIPDPYYILPVLMMGSMVLQQLISPSATTDPVQRRMMMILPLVFGVMFAFFPAGLVLYWLTNNCVSILQQWYIMRSYDVNKNKWKHKKEKNNKK